MTSARRKRKPIATQRASSDSGPPDSRRQRAPKRAIWIGAGLLATIVFVATVTFHMVSGGGRAALLAQDAGGPAVAATFVGSATCAGCHQPEATLWGSSQHKRAMDHATDKTVLGDFSDVTFDYFGLKSRFFRKDGRFFVETDGPDGKLDTFEVKYTFGVDPLQQYLIGFPDGRIQALSIAWDTRPKDKGGQRWFHLYPNEAVRHGDILHWTKLNQNWNFMCAECHSTGVRKNYDAAHDQFATTWAEISVGCEACHGQGSRHVSWAHKRQDWWPFGKSDDPAKGLLVHFDERRDVSWPISPKTGNGARSVAPAALRKEVETCGLCHARRSAFSEDWVPGRWLSDTHIVSPLARGLYHADGQMLDEVYNYGSFKQSRMFAAGVTCSDCHEPHGAKLRAPGDGVCLQCHDSGKYATVAHNGHAAAAPAIACASCHMPVHTYMVVDQRHDHSLRIPRPDLSVKLGTPNACNDCHKDKSAEWAASAIAQWQAPNRQGFQNYAEAFHAAWSDQADAAMLLAAVAGDGGAPAFARAGALSELGPHLSPSIASLMRTGLADPDPMVRIGALDMLEGGPGLRLWPFVSPLLSDSVRGVRIRAASLLATVPSASQPPADRERFDLAAAEFVAAQRLNADRPEARATLGNYFARRGMLADAEIEYKAALRLSAQYAPAAINLADLYRQLGRENEGEAVLRTVVAASPQDAGLHYALGLTLVRLKHSDDALEELRRAADIEPDRARYAYVYAVALHSAGRVRDSIELLKQNAAQHPRDRETLSALINFHREVGDAESALLYAEQLSLITPEDEALTLLVQELRQQDKKPVAQ
jgi:predicted CXXCH cytochrome family protein